MTLNLADGSIRAHYQFTSSIFVTSYGSLGLTFNGYVYLFMYCSSGGTDGIAFFWYHYDAAPTTTAGFTFKRISGTTGMRIDKAHKYNSDFIALSVFDTVNSKSIVMVITESGGVHTVRWMKGIYNGAVFTGGISAYTSGTNYYIGGCLNHSPLTASFELFRLRSQGFAVPDESPSPADFMFSNLMSTQTPGDLRQCNDAVFVD